jgi:hypothetical protein
MIAVFLILMLTALLPLAADAASTDIVPRGSTLNDAFAKLAGAGLLGEKYGASDFLWESQRTRAQLARILESGLLENKSELAEAEANPQWEPMLRGIVISLRPELTADGYDADDLLGNMLLRPAAENVLLQPEGRFGTRNSHSQSGAMALYRGSVLGDLGTNSRYAFSVSNQSEDWRRVFDNEIGPHDQSGITEAYLSWKGYHGLGFDIGRMYDRWGPGYRGATLLSDNAPPMDQMRIEFPFSLGPRLGRNWQYTQVASTFKEYGTQKYFQARRIELNLNSHWNADFEEAVKSSRAAYLLAAPMPFYLFKGITLSSLDVHSNYNFNLGLNYSSGPDLRVYSQLMVDDIKSPFRGRFLGFDVGDNGTTPQKLAYLVGLTGQTPQGTGLTVEYDASDPTTYGYQNNEAIWQQGTYNYLGLPSGPDSREVFARLSQRLTSKISIALEDRNRWRRDNSFVEPSANDLAAYALLKLDQRNGVTIGYHQYRQDPFPFAPGSPGYPASNSFTPLSEGNPGQRLRINELDLGYQLAF